MAKTFRQSQAFLHTWSGLLLGWVLFLVFITGTMAFYREGLNRWMHPEMARIEQPLQVLDRTQHFLEEKAPDAKIWYLDVPDTHSAGSTVYWQPSGDSPRSSLRDNTALVGATGDPMHPRESRGGEFFYRFHFDLHYMPVIWARLIVGLAAMMMLVAICSGIVTHKKIFKDFFSLRRKKGQRSWLDGHNATAVLALPFHLMITYTGLVTLMALLMPWAVVANYDNQAEIQNQLFPDAPAVEASGVRTPMLPLSTLVEKAEAQLNMSIGSIQVSNPGDENARVLLTGSPKSMLDTRPPRIAFDGVSGKEVWRSPEQGAAMLTAGVMVGLHAGRFSGETLRMLYFLAGVAGTLMVASGLVMWTVKRREKLPDPTRPHFGFRLVERLNVATIGGFSLGIVAMFWANRLLPDVMADRAAWEINWLFITWGLSAVLTLPFKPKWGWVALFALTGVGLVALPFYNILAGMHGLNETLADGDGVLAGIDIALIIFGLASCALARSIARHQPQQRRKARAMRDIAPEPANTKPIPQMPVPEPAE
ncbi:PepSY domain-containing protein [Altererythrobacter indicus]|uniref:PepSY domain-containing protein n=1 Tax=Altericroceibacterium indicum TaxID=374177 RepID=A0A845AEQ1_9SPHN|nr:PepSY-associated TM helix domain-containing protein [Altericroceibacterium indicum]MXP27026.1 PepSY domain-containing protein [Altericroceibacterium indicum]